MKVVVTLGALVVLAACARDSASTATVRLRSPDLAIDANPAWSPDGTRMAWWSLATDSSGLWQLWTGNADMSSPIKLAATSNFSWMPVWSPDGTQIASASAQAGLAHVFLVPVAGGAGRQLTHGAGVEYPLGWTKDGERLAYYGTGEGGSFRSQVVFLKTGVSMPLVPGEKRPTLGMPSPDGRHIAFFIIDGGKLTIWVADSIGGTPRQLTNEGFENLVQFQSWSPDSKELLYESRRTGTTDLWILPIDGSKPRQLTRDVRNDYGGVFSPDGKWVAFLSNRGKQTDIWVVSSAGGVEHRVTDSPEEEEGPLTWRAGTNEIGYVTRTAKGGVWALDLTDEKERRLTPDSLRAGFFNVSPDGKQVLYLVERGGGIRDLMVVPFAGGAARTLIAGGGYVETPYWSPDGSKIAFVSDRGGTRDIWVIDAAGGAPRQLVAWPTDESSACWSGDGSAIYFVSTRDARLGDVWKVSPAGGGPVRVTTDGAIAEIYTLAGVADAYVATINPRGGQLGISRLSVDGKLKPVWEKSSLYSPTISPKGDSITAIVEQPDKQKRTMMLASDGTGGRVILGPSDQARWWSNDGKWLVYTVTAAGGVFDLAVMQISDRSTRRLTTTKLEDETGAEVTPDGKAVVFRRTLNVTRITTADLTMLLRAKD